MKGIKEIEQCLAIRESLEDLLLEGVFQLSEHLDILFASDVVIKILGYSSLDELKDQNLTSFFGCGEQLQSFRETLVGAGQVLRHRAHLKNVDGIPFWVEISIRAKERDGIVWYEGCIRDITEQLSTEHLLAENKLLLERLNFEMERFVSGVSHDLRAPISSILGIVDVMAHDKEAANTSTYLEMLTTCASRASTFIQDIVSFTRNSRKEVCDQPIVIADVVNEVIGELGQNHPHGKTVVSNIVSKGDSLCYSDFTLVKTIISHVIKNAFDFADVAKSVAIMSVDILYFPSGASVEIYDNGIGIRQSQVQRIFDMFYRASSVSKGSGLGLYAARDLANKIGATIEVNSQHGVGTSVVIDIPNSTQGQLMNGKVHSTSGFFND